MHTSNREFWSHRDPKLLRLTRDVKLSASYNKSCFRVLMELICQTVDNISETKMK